MQDNGGTANGGVDLDQSANTITINVTSVNDAPAGTDNTVTINEDAQLHLRRRRLRLQRSERRSRPTLFLAVMITTLPAAGTLTLNGVAVDAGDVVSVADIAAGNLVFTPAANANGTAYASFTFQVQDNGGTANGGVDLDQSANTSPSTSPRSTTRRPAPTARSRSTRTPAYTFAAADFGFSDPIDDPGQRAS